MSDRNVKRKIQDHFGADEVREVAEKVIVARGFESRQDEHYRDFPFYRYLFSYTDANGHDVDVYFDYNEDNVEECCHMTREVGSLSQWDREMFLVSFFGVDEK